MLQPVARVRHLRILQPYRISTFIESLVKFFLDLESVAFLMDKCKSKLGPDPLKTGPKRPIVYSIVWLCLVFSDGHSVEFADVSLESGQSTFDQILSTENGLGYSGQYH